MRVSHFYQLKQQNILFTVGEDEVDGIDPIIRVWNLDKVFFCRHNITFHSCLIQYMYFLVDTFQCTCKLCVLIIVPLHVFWHGSLSSIVFSG